MLTGMILPRLIVGLQGCLCLGALRYLKVLQLKSGLSTAPHPLLKTDVTTLRLCNSPSPVQPLRFITPIPLSLFIWL